MSAMGLGTTLSNLDTTIPQPFERTPVLSQIATVRRMADGSARKDVTRVVRKWSLSWRGLTPAQLATLEAYYEHPGPLYFRDINGVTYSVLIVDDMAGSTLAIAGGLYRENPTLSFEEVGRAGTTGDFTIGVSTIGGDDTFGGNPPWIFTIGASTIGGTGTLAAN